MPKASDSQAARALRAGREALAAQIPDGGAGRRFTQELSALVDTYFQARMAEVWPRGAAPGPGGGLVLAAVGGYGRAELCLHSDIDILVLCRGRIPARALDMAQALFYPLWDMGLDLGHGFRGIRECVALARKDFEVMASLLDARAVAGDTDVLAGLRATLAEKVEGPRARAFTDWLAGRNAERLARHGDSSALLEPDLKQGAGGLRDIHQILWLGRVHYGAGTLEALLRTGRLTEAQAHFLADAQRLLLRVRNLLHHVSGRRNDRLHLALQPRVAAALGYEDGPDSLAVERFLGRLHRDMAGIKALHAAFRAGLPAAGPVARSGLFARPAPAAPALRPLGPGVAERGGQLYFDVPGGYPRDPQVLSDIFVHSARSGLPLSWEARGFVSGHLHLVRERLRDAPGAVQGLLDVLVSGRAAPALGQMLETGYLGALLPDFGRVQDLVQFDTYHIYPVGQHTLRAIELLEGPLDGPGRAFAALRDELDGPRRTLALMLGTLLHDIGKGLGGGHSQKGRAIATALLERWGQAPALTADVAALVGEHLTLYETATRRDLGDEAVVAACAGLVGDEQRLRLLMLLSFADASATGPGVWKPWAAGLLWELYAKVLHILRGGRLASADAVRALDRTRAAVRRRAAADFAPGLVEELLELMPQRYLLTASPEAVVRHMGMVRRLRAMVAEAERVRPGGRGGTGVVVVEAGALPGHGCWEVAIAGMDTPGLFATLAGVLALHGVNIVAAQCFSWRDRTVVDVFTVSDPPELLAPDELWARVAASVRGAMSGRLDLDWRIREKRNAPSALKPLEIEPEVAIHNAASDFHTVIEITAADRLGLLYDVGTALHGLGLSVGIAKIATYGDRVADVFYVREAGGGKVEAPERLRAVEATLLECLGAD